MAIDADLLEFAEAGDVDRILALVSIEDVADAREAIGAMRGISRHRRSHTTTLASRTGGRPLLPRPHLGSHGPPWGRGTGWRGATARLVGRPRRVTYHSPP